MSTSESFDGVKLTMTGDRGQNQWWHWEAGDIFWIKAPQIQWNKLEENEGMVLSPSTIATSISDYLAIWGFPEIGLPLGIIHF